MKNTFKILIVGLGFAALVGCQQVNPVEDKPFTPPPAAGNGITLCSDGTLNCYVTFPTNAQTFDTLDFSQSYVACMDACLPASCTDSGGDIIDEATSECPTQFASCDAQCSLTSNESPIAGIPDSDGVTLPENPKAILVEITGCFSTRRMNEIHFDGTNISVVSEPEGKYNVQTSGGFFGIGGSKSVNIAYDVGRNFNCPTEYKNKIKVVAKPQSGTSVALGSHNITIVPFANTAVVTKVRAMPHSLSFGAISTDMLAELDLSEVVVIPASFGTPSPSIAHAFNDWRYYNNSDLAYGTTVMFGGYYFVAPFSGATGAVMQTMSAYIFAKSKQ